ncbi:ABC transporter substrate-binding protein [Halovenus marina]|uniref:ABC transporter substrate-binding protein n=1 Tax=Halovenus marina TaxID=3396621 RepID=UPI003F572FB6
MPDSTDQSPLNSTRRKLLSVLGTGSVIALAGCSGDDDGDSDGDGTGDGDGDSTGDGDGDSTGDGDGDGTGDGDGDGTGDGDGDGTGSEGGTLNYGLTGPTDTVDPVISSSAEESIIFNNIFETLVATGNDGQLYNWLASSYEITDVQGIGPADYEPYMREVPLDDDGFAAPEDGAQVLVEHPDNEGDTGLALTVEEAQAAVEDGTYGVELTAELHEGVEFHNGEELTAQHVVDSYERHENTSFGTQVFDDVLYSVADGDYSLRIYGQVPDVEASRRLPVPYIFSNEQMDLEPGAMDPRSEAAPIGTGPYQFSEMEGGQYWILERHDNYWMQNVGVDNKGWSDGAGDVPDRPPIQTLDLSIITETSTRAGALESGEIDGTFNLTPDQRGNFANADGYTVDGTPAGSFVYFQLPAREEAEGPWHHQEVRKAFNHSIPRGLIVDEIRNGLSEPGVVPVPRVAGSSCTFGYDEAVDEFEDMVAYDLDRAGELIEEAGVETPIETTIVTNGNDDPRVSLANLTIQAMNQRDFWDISLETEPTLDALSDRIEADGFWQTNETVLIGIGGGVVPELYMQVIHNPAFFQTCCQYQNLDFPDLAEALNEASTSLDAVEDPDYRRQVWMDDIHPSVLELSANCLIDFEEETGIVNSNVVSGFRKYFSQSGTLSYMTYAPYDGVAASVNQS